MGEYSTHTYPSGITLFPYRQLATWFFFVLCLLLVKLEYIESLKDDWYGFVSFEDSYEFKDTYAYTCSYKYDLFREPKQFSRRDSLRARQEPHTPIRFSVADAIKADTNYTLHIYNNPAVRKGFTVSYGFLRNKECLRGQDSECVVYPELGRVRALVVNAERFSDKQNLNYIKDHFLVESAERFVSILNGGSVQERKFYEAVFLGGYTDDPTRTSHQVDGKKYPLEIYMYFLDEAVPSVSLSTILVVLVEESNTDNHLVNPIINAVELELYDAERRFLENNKATTRRERLFHHLESSTYYDVYDKDNQVAINVPIIHEPMGSSVELESAFSQYVEMFERMQALETQLFFLFEDLEIVSKLEIKNMRQLDDMVNRRLKKHVPTNFTEYLMLTWAVLNRGMIWSRNEKLLNVTPTCQSFNEYWLKGLQIFIIRGIDQFAETSQVPEGEHMDAFVKLVTDVCDHFDKVFTTVHATNLNATIMNSIKGHEKYWMIRDLHDERTRRDAINKLISTHFHGNANGTSKYHEYGPTDEKPEYENENQATHIADGIYNLYKMWEKRENYKVIRARLANEIEEITKQLKYSSTDEMQEAMKLIKQGSMLHELKYFRHVIHSEFLLKNLPIQEKKRTLVELGGMEISPDELKTYEEMNPVKVPVTDLFQISWLIPPSGGYYYYKGSSPVPPCFRAQNVILFKQPIKMSRRQIEILTRVPVSFNRSEDIRVTTPHVYDASFEVELSAPDTEQSRIEEVIVPVYDQSKNHLFLGHDGVQQNAVKEWEKIKLIAAGKIAGIAVINQTSFAVLVAMLIFLGVVNLWILVILNALQ